MEKYKSEYLSAEEGNDNRNYPWIFNAFNASGKSLKMSTAW